MVGVLSSWTPMAAEHQRKQNRQLWTKCGVRLSVQDWLLTAYHIYSKPLLFGKTIALKFSDINRLKR